MKPHTRQSPCPICDGYRELDPGKGVRCWGFISEDGDYAHCSREDRAGGIEFNGKSSAYPHRLRGSCKCGETHGEAPAEAVPIGAARGAREVAHYDYTSAEGTLLYQVVRKEPKAFMQRAPRTDGGWAYSLAGIEPTIYRLPEVIAAREAGDTIFIAEGEKDVETLRAAGCIATCNSGGATKWKESFAEHFSGADVVIVRDKDEKGNEHARQVFASVRPVVKSLRVVEARQGKDAADHLAAGLTVNDFVPVWPAEDLRKTDPVAWKRRMLRMSVDIGEPLRKVDQEAAIAAEREPVWPTGLEGEASILPNFRGVTILSGPPSSGKSYLAVASAVQAAWSGWDVVYLSAEMADRPMAKRFRAYCEGPAPERLHHVDVSFGASVENLLDWIEPLLSDRNALVVFDSLSSFADQSEQQPGDDPHQIGLLKRIVMWSVNVRRATNGQIAFLLLSEINKEGRAKGRFADHKADLAISMQTSAEHSVLKRITVTKGWEYQSGEMGEFALDVGSARLRRIA